MRRLRSEHGAVSTIIFLVYVVIGVLVALQQGYLRNLGSVRGIISFLLAVLLWPLVLLGVDLQLGRN